MAAAPRPLGLDALEEVLPSLVEEMERSVPYAAALAIRREGMRVSQSSTQGAAAPEPPSLGLVLTAFNGEAFFERSLNAFSVDEVARASRELADWAASVKPPSVQQLDPGEPLKRRWETPARVDPASWTLKQRMEHVRALQASLAAAHPKVANATAIVADLHAEELFVNRAKLLRQRLQRVDEAMHLVVAEGGRAQALWGGISRGGGFEHLGWCAPRAKALAEDAARLLGAGRVPPGMHTVVTDPEWSGILAHEAFGHGAETDMFLKDRAKGREYLGKRVGSELVDLDDDPTLPGQAATFFFDHEGALARRNAIIVKGVLKAGMTDFFSAHHLKMERSANGRRESWERKAYARMTNTFFRPGALKPAELIASTEEGWYLRHPSNGMEDPQGWGIQCEGLWAQHIVKGKLTDEVCSPVILTGFVPEILSSVDAVADDLEISGLGHCGKGHKEWVKNTMGGPHMRFKARLA